MSRGVCPLRRRFTTLVGHVVAARFISRPCRLFDCVRTPGVRRSSLDYVASPYRRWLRVF